MTDPHVDPPARGHRVPFIGAFESTFHPRHDRDVGDFNGHWEQWNGDLDALLRAGVRRVRYPMRWHRIEAWGGAYDFSATDRELGYLREHGVEPIIDLVHHTSYPAWLDDGFRDRRFPGAYRAYAEAVAARYPWITSYTLFNEPFATLFLAGHQALWPPYDRGMAGFVRLAKNVLPAICAVARQWAGALPDARHIWVDTCEHHAGTPGEPSQYAALANDRRHVLLDLVLGHDLDEKRPFLRQLIDAGGGDLLSLPPIKVDVLGLDYYCHSEWWYDETGGHSPSARPLGFSALAQQYSQRYGLPMMLTETNLRGLPSDRASWLRHMLEQYEVAVDRGVPLEGFCWFPHVDSCDWDSLLARPAARPDPVGVLSLGADRGRIRTSFSAAWEAAASGTPSAGLPAYRFQAPCDAQLSGLLSHMAHWLWQEAPFQDLIHPIHIQLPIATIPASDPKEPSVSPIPTDLVVLSHLRWTWVWQRPQHLVSRFAAERKRAGARTWFVEEPMAADVPAPVLRQEERDGIIRLWLEVPAGHDGDYAGFDDPRAVDYAAMVRRRLEAEGAGGAVDVLLYTPMALDIAHALKPRHMSYDVMDDLASFLGAPHSLKLRQKHLLSEADVVFAGGRSLYRGIHQHREDCHLFPSGVDITHYLASRTLRSHRQPQVPPVAGYVGVIDERVDLGLLEGLAAALPHWRIRIVGPIAKIDPASLPQAPNLEYPGMASYGELPRIMADFDVALMPFALNEATRSISPTKTLEYLAAGLPVVSTRIPDVVTDYASLVHFAKDATEFAAACQTQLKSAHDWERESGLDPFLKQHSWDHIASAMAELISSRTLDTLDLVEETA